MAESDESVADLEEKLQELTAQLHAAETEVAEVAVDVAPAPEVLEDAPSLPVKNAGDVPEVRVLQTIYTNDHQFETGELVPVSDFTQDQMGSLAHLGYLGAPDCKWEYKPVVLNPPESRNPSLVPELGAVVPADATADLRASMLKAAE